MNQPLWTPPKRLTALSEFSKHASDIAQIDLSSYDKLHEWSVTNIEDFWSLIWEFCKIRASKTSERIVENKNKMPGARWFPDAKINFTENLLRRNDQGPAIISRGESKPDRVISYSALNDKVNRLARAFRLNGLKPGDRVAAYMPNIMETVICMLATASCGAVWSSCSPDFGVRGVIDRFGQIEPKILISVDGYYYNNKSFDITDKLKQIHAQLPTVKTFLIVPYLDEFNSNFPPSAISYDDFISGISTEPIEHIQLPFNHPLYILFSSGTTGAPKCIVHGAGGTLLQHLKEHTLHVNIKFNDRIFFFTTCGWMMWNWLVTALASNATILLYEGSPFQPGAGSFFDFIELYRIEHFGISAKYIDAIAKSGLRPIETHQLSSLKTIMSTGSPLSPEGFDFVYSSIKKDVCLSSISGGTDLISCFVLGNPNLPVRCGEIQCKGLGMDISVFNDQGKEVPTGTKGELVCRNTFPSMPIEFWKDKDGERYRSSYFKRFPGVWHHGDYVELTEHGGMIVYGRSDAVLNPGGVRIGTAEIYRQAEQVDEVVESVVVGQQWNRDTRVILFVKLRENITLDDELKLKIKNIIRTNASPRHVPSKILQVTDIPRTKNGKITEIAIRKIIHGESIDNLEALDNPEALNLFRDLIELQTD